jgi:SAM-dependent methyltransferase
MGKLKSGKPRTKNPSKQLLFLRVHDFLRKNGKYDTALDLACGTMYFADLIQADKYVGVDLDAERLARGKADHPQAETVHCKIEDLPRDVSGNLVLCLQCVGVNKHFDNRQTLEVVDRILGSVRQGGDLVFNIGPRAAGCFDDIDARIQSAFAECRRYDYGRFNDDLFKKRKGLVAAMVLAQLMRAFPGLARSSSLPKRLYLCKGKRQTAAVPHGEVRGAAVAGESV